MAQALAARQLPDILVVATSDGGVGLFDGWQETDRVLLIDGIHSGAPPGTLHEFDLCCQLLPTHLVTCSSHTFGVAQVVELARTLERLPAVLRFYGIEGACFDVGTRLSPAVTCRVPQLVDRIAAHVCRELSCETEGDSDGRDDSEHGR